MASPTDTPMFGRVLTAMITPFDDIGQVDYDASVRVARFLVENGSDGLVVSGTTGESPTLTFDEKVQLFRKIKEAVGPAVPVLAGTGSYNTHETIELSQAAERCKVDGLLVVTPYYNKPSQEGLYQHFTAVANSTSLPVMLYNVPTRTITNIEPATIRRLAEHPRIVAVKEASANLAQIGEVAQITPPDFLIYSGSDEVNLPVLSLGAVGVVSVISNVAGNDVKKMVEAFVSGDLETARTIHLNTLALTRAMFSFPSPGPAKTALTLLGVIGNAGVRLPLACAQDVETASIAAALRDYGLLGG